MNWAQLLHFSGDISTKKPIEMVPGISNKDSSFLHYSMHVFVNRDVPVVNRVMPVVLNRATCTCPV